MKIFDMDRGTGKTSLLIQISAVRQARIITATEAHAKYIKHMALNMNRNIPEPMSYNKYSRINEAIDEEILIDELDFLLQSFFPHNKLIAATRSSSEYKDEYYELDIERC